MASAKHHVPVVFNNALVSMKGRLVSAVVHGEKSYASNRSLMAGCRCQQLVAACMIGKMIHQHIIVFESRQDISDECVMTVG
jgi:hypothetical protein